MAELALLADFGCVLIYFTDFAKIELASCICALTLETNYFSLDDGFGGLKEGAKTFPGGGPMGQGHFWIT